VSGDGVAGAQPAADAAREHSQHLVADGVTEGVVDPLERVEVDEGDADRIARRRERASASSSRSE
jgi:hypothetical protein